MGGPHATDDLQKGFETQVWLAVSENASVSGNYYFHQKEVAYRKEADDPELQNLFLEKCAQITGIPFPG